MGETCEVAALQRTGDHTPWPVDRSTRIADTCAQHAAEKRYHGVTLSDLSAVSGVSERRVRRAFYESFGISPTVYLRTAALHEVRRALIEGMPARDAVTRAASEYGFWHLGRFAAQYRFVFGERPSETVAQRARAC